MKTLINWLEKVHMCFNSLIFRVTFLTLQCYETLKHDVAILQDFLKKDITFSSLLVYHCENEFSIISSHIINVNILQVTFLATSFTTVFLGLT